MAHLRQSCRDKIDIEGLKYFDIDARGGIKKFGRLIVPNICDLRKDILEDSHRSKFTIHPGSSKMYADVKRLYYWDGMKYDIF